MIERIIGIICATMVILGFICFFGLFFGAGKLDWWIPTIYISEVASGVLIIILKLINDAWK